jgi:hypothetical protein
MQDFIKIKIISCSQGESYHELVGEHGMGISVADNKYYRIRNDKYPYIRKEDTIPCDDPGRNF